MRIRGDAAVSRRALLALNIALGIALLAAVAGAVWWFSPKGHLERGGDVAAGVRPVLTITGSGRGQLPEFARPAGAAFAPDGGIYVSDTGNHRVVEFRSNGRYESEFGGFGMAKPFANLDITWEPGLMNHPLGMDVGEDGHIYVADHRNEQIQVFGPDGVFVRRFPDPAEVVGSGTSGRDGTGIAVTDVALAVAGDIVFAADTHQILAFTTEGEFVRQFGRQGTGPGEFDRITGIEVDPAGVVYVADSGNKRIQALTADGAYLWSIGGPAIDSDVSGGTASPYEFASVQDVALLGDGSLAALDAVEGTIVLFTRDGSFVGRYGRRGGAPGEMKAPTSIDALGSQLLVTDTGNGRVQVIELVR